MELRPLVFLLLLPSLGCAFEVEDVGPGAGRLNGDEAVETALPDGGTGDTAVGGDAGADDGSFEEEGSIQIADPGASLDEPAIDGPLIAPIAQCSPETEDRDCPGTSCNPATKRCSTYKVESRPACWTCVSDSDCEQPDHRCVEMYFLGERFPDARTGFCLPIATADDADEYDCNRPLTMPLVDRPSLSGGALQTYCGVHEKLTTCFGVRAFQSQEECPGGLDEECPVGGICRAFEKGNRKVHCCTFECTDRGQCPVIDGMDQTCGGYCGG
jgi:hypothetical protein